VAGTWWQLGNKGRVSNGSALPFALQRPPRYRILRAVDVPAITHPRKTIFSFCADLVGSVFLNIRRKRLVRDTSTQMDDMKIKRLIWVFLVISFCLLGKHVSAMDWTIQQITNNSYGEYGVRIYENKLVWQGYPEQDESEIFYFDGTTVHQLTDTATYEFFPEISSGGIVWAGNIPTWNGVGDVYFYDYNTITVLASNCVRKLDVDIFEDKIVWSDANTGQLMLYQGGNISPIEGAFGWRPRMSSGGILYTYGDNNSPHLYLYDWDIIIDLGETTDSDADSNQPSQQINENRVTWFKNVGGYANNEVMLYDIPSKTLTQITNGNTHYGQPMQPYVSGDYVAWYDLGNTGINPLNLYDGQQILTIAESDWMSVSTYFGDVFLAWSMRYNGQPDFFVYDLVSQEIIQITNDIFEESGFVADGVYVAYLSHDGNDSDIYLARRISGPELEGDLNGDGEVDLADAILAFQIIAGMQSLSYVNIEADVNGDGRIGLEEALYTLQKVSGLRNQPPELNPIGNKMVDEGSTLSFEISASDPDGDILTFSAANLPEGATFDANTRTFSWTPYYSQSGIYDVTFTVTDTLGASDSSIATITVNNSLPVFHAAEYFPLTVGNWWDFEDDQTGELLRSTVVGTKSIGNIATNIYQYASGDKEYYTSDSNGIRLHGIYMISAEYTGDVIFDTPLLLVPDNSQMGTIQVSDTTYSVTIYIEGYGYLPITVDLTSTVRILDFEDIATEHEILRDCIKVSWQISEYIRELDETIVSDTTYYWLHKGVGTVKQVDSSQSMTITASNVNGVTQSY
jgi:hypothetical protein